MLALGGCTDGPDPTIPEPRPTRTAEAAPSPAPTKDAPTSDAPPVDARPTAAPGPRIEAGIVADGSPVETGGSGPAEVTFGREGDIAVVAHVDCTGCTGAAVLTGPGRSSPWGEGFAGQDVAYLFEILEDSADKQALWLAVEGEWSLRLESWNDLPRLTGEQSGTGPSVLFLADRAPAVHITYKPADDDDQLSARYAGTTEGTALFFGDTEPMDETVDLTLPGVLSINTRGSWTVTPLP